MQTKSLCLASLWRVGAIASLVLTCAAFITMPSPVQAQTVTGTILGNVLDSSGAAVPNAQITITNQDTGVVREAASTGDGIYNVPSLLPGKYTVEAKAPGFTPGGVKDVVVNVGSNTRVDITLQLGQVTQQVTVSEALPTIETTSSEVAQVMDEQIIQNIPLNARDLQQLSVIQPGVQQTYTSSFGKQVSVGGDRVANNRFLQEGIDLTWTFRTSPVSLASNILMGADAVKEFKVIAENPPVEYGELSGGITSTTFKSGTNNIHGTVFEYYRNSGVDARNFFDATTTPPPLHRHQFGGQFGGPIQKDKTFYFADFESLRSDAAQSFTAPVPDLTARNSAVPAIQQIFFGATPTGGVGANLPLMPACNDGRYNKASVGLCNFNSNPIQSVREYYGVGKIDHSFGSKNTLSSSYNIDQSNEYEPTQLDVTADDVYMRRQVWTVQDTHIISTNVVNTFRFGIHRINYAGSLDLATSAPIDPRLYVNVNPNIVSRSPFPQVPALTFLFGGQALGSPALGFNYVPRFIGYTNGSIGDDVNYLHGNHAFQFGFQAKKWYDNIENYMSTPRGAYTFGTLPQFLCGGLTALQSGNPTCPAAPGVTGFAWWVQNYTDPNNGVHYDSNFARGVRLMSYGIYAEDTYKVKPNLTVTYGLRWEYATAPSEEHNRISNLYAKDGSCNPFTCAAPQVGAPWYHPPKDNFAPRVGFNWDPFKKGKTSVRGGAGIMFAEMEDDYWYPTLASQPPFTIAVSLPGGQASTNPALAVSLPFNNVNGTSNSALNNFLAANPNIFTRETYGGAEFPHFKTPTKYAFNLTIQQELPDHISFSIGYVGSQARHQGRTYNYSDYFPTTIETPGQLPAVNGVPIPGSVVNPSCITAGSIECYYWAGSVTGSGLGASNANVLPTSTPNYATLYAPYAYACQGGAIKPPCYNNPNWSNAVGGNITDGNASYNALQTVLMRRMSPGLFARFNYTFAKCIADSGDNLPGQYTNGGSAAFPLIFSHSAGRGRCAYLGTNSANFTLTYDTPWGRASQSMLVKNVLANWEITTQTLVSSGVPFTVGAGDDVARYTTVGGAGADRPNWAAPSAACPNPNPTGAINKHNPINYVNQACFALAPAGYLGNVGPLVFTGPNTINTDISLRKTIPMKREGMSFVVSADMFNAFNRTNFSAPTVLNAFTTSGAANGTLGAINTNNPYATVTTSRQFQINGRFVF